ncbi:MAG: hypothetical protein HUU50_16885 [Candidatus Brocadiae bacterium]|nr:hypothetical protein [Candidatus Brocadiia bacterium]
MLRYILLLLCVFLAVSCHQNKEYAKTKAVGVPEITHKDPKNPIDTELIDWKPYGKNIDTQSSTYKEYSSYFPKIENSALKNRIIVVSMEDSLKPWEEKFKLALFCTGKFVVVERDLEKYASVLQQIAQNPEEALKTLSNSLHSQYLLILKKEKNQSKWILYSLLEKKQLHEESIPEENVLPIIANISHDVSKADWKGQIASEPLPDNKVIINAGALDGVKKGDTFKVESPLKEEGEEEILVIEEVEDKYATSRIKGMKSLSKGTNIKEVKS